MTPRLGSTVYERTTGEAWRVWTVTPNGTAWLKSYDGQKRMFKPGDFSMRRLSSMPKPANPQSQKPKRRSDKRSEKLVDRRWHRALLVAAQTVENEYLRRDLLALAHLFDVGRVQILPSSPNRLSYEQAAEAMK